MKFSIQVQERDERAKTSRWITYRHRDGAKNVAMFETIGAVRRFVRKHCLNLVGPVRVIDLTTGLPMTLTRI